MRLTRRARPDAVGSRLRVFAAGLLRSPQSRAAAGYLAWLAILTPLTLALYAVFSGPLPPPMDLLPTYIAAKLWANGIPDAVYQTSAFLNSSQPHPQWLAEYQRSRLPVVDSVFVYHPVYLALWRPLVHLLSPSTCWWVFRTLGVSATLVAGYEAARIAGAQAIAVRWAVALLVALSAPAMIALVLGQNVGHAAGLSILGFRCMLGAPLTDLRWGRLRAGFGVGLLLLACAFKPWIVLLLGVLALTGRWSLFGASVLGYLALYVALPVLAFPAVLNQKYLGLLKSMGEMAPLAHNNLSLRAFLVRLQTPEWPLFWEEWNSRRSVGTELWAAEAAILAVVACGFAVLVYLRAPRLEVIGCAAMALILLPLGVVWQHYLIWLAPATVLALWSRPVLLRMTAAVVAAWLMRGLIPFLPQPHFTQPRDLWAFAISAPLLLGVGLALALCFVSRDSRLRPARPKPQETPDPSKALDAGTTGGYLTPNQRHQRSATSVSTI